MKKTYQLTSTGRKELEAELEQLKGRRGEIADKIAEARDYGDLSENAEYDSAREEQGIVTLKNGKKEVVYTVVGPVEANPLEGKISNESPIGLALMGKKIGETAVITTPKGEITYEVVSVA